MGKYILAIDQGTTGSRAFIFDQAGTIVAQAYQEFKQYYPKPGCVEHEPQEIWSSICACITQSIQKSKINPKQIAAIGITNQRETTLVWDRQTGKPLHRAIVWQDRRTAERCALASLRKHAAYIQNTTGLRLDPYFSATKLEWLLDNIFHAKVKAKKGNLMFGTMDTWVLYQLTGRTVHATDYTNASRTMLFNIQSKTWDPKLLKIFNVPQSCLPQTFASGHTFGRTLGLKVLPDGIPITAMMGDQQAALYGQGCFKMGSMKNTYGTGCFLLLNTGHKKQISKKGLLTTLACDVHGQPIYALEGAVFIAGAVVQWLRDELQIISDSNATEKAILRVKDTAGVYFVPAFVGLGAPYWNPNARGIITGLTRGANRAHIIRAALEAIAYQAKDIVGVMEQETKLHVKALNVDGGACRNAFLMQFQADILGSTIMRPKAIDTTVSGVAHLAGVIAGVYKPKDLERMRGLDRCFNPKMKASHRNILYAGWQKAVAQAMHVC